MRDRGLRFRARRWLRRRRFRRRHARRSRRHVIAGLAVLGALVGCGPWPFPDALPQALSLTSWMKQAPRLAGPLATTLATRRDAVGAGSPRLVVLCLMREDETGRRPGQAGGLMLLYLPLIVPQAAFLFGLQLLLASTARRRLARPLVLAHLVFVTPYVFLSLSDPWRAFDRRYEAVAAGLGKGRWTILVSVELPMLLARRS